MFVFGRPEGILRVSAYGGTPALIVEAEEGEQVYGPQVLPGGEWVLFTVTTVMGANRWDEAQIVVQSLNSGARKVLWEGGSDARYIPTGHLVYALGGVLYAMVFDLDSLEVVGGPVSLIEGIARAPNPGSQTATAHFSFSNGGSLVYLKGAVSAFNEGTLVMVDREGEVEPLGAPRRRYDDLRLSPDGQRLAAQVWGEQSDVWIYDIPRKTLTRLTFEGHNDTPIWTPDGKRVTFDSSRTGGRDLFWKPADGSGTADQLTTSQSPQFSTSWTPDGKFLAFREVNETSDIWVLSLADEPKPEPFLQTRFQEGAGMFSPDGRWLAYTSNESGQFEIYVQPFPGPGGKWQISTGGGSEPIWAHSGRELFYRNGPLMMMVDITTEPGFSAGNPKLLFEGQYFANQAPANANYDVTPDGQRFIMIKAADEEQEQIQINVVTNWFEELKERVPVP